jgi:phosphoribosylanthranilate isomerase
VLDVPDGVLSVAVYVGEPGENAADADLAQVYERAAGTVRGRDGVLLRDGDPVARVRDLPWQEVDPGHHDRAAAAASSERVMLAGRLDGDNVRAAIEHVRPWAVDACSRLEAEPGVKDPQKVTAFVEAARC